MAEFNMFEIMYPIVEVVDERMETFFRCHMRLIENYTSLSHEYDRIKGENTRLKQRSGIDKERYSELEQKYWDAQRLIDKYEQENSDLKSKLDWEKSVSEYLGEQLDNIYESGIEQECTKCQIKYEKVLMEREKLRNELSAERIKSEERQKYLEAYQKLYVDECMKNRKDKKDGKDCQS